MTLLPPSHRLPLGFRDGREALVLVLIAAGMVWFYGWTASPEGTVWKHGGRAGDYYNSEVEGFRSGHLWMATEVPAALRALADPYDPAKNAPYRLHDASYYHGHYYLYFGVTPAILFFWPVKALTGLYASEAQGVLFFCVVGYLASLGLLLAIRRRYFAEAGLAPLVAGAIAVGLITMVPSLLRRPAVYEVPIACAYACILLALAALWRALHSGRAAIWTSVASLAYGLAVGARPNCAFGAAFLLLPFWQQIREGGTGGRPLALARTAAAAVAPIAAVVAGLMLYNFGRFGSPFEFGQKYQLSGVLARGLRPFSLRYLWFNLRVYVTAPAGISAYFPYITVIRPPPAPPGQSGIEDPFGILPNLPFVVFCLGSALGAAGRPRLARWLLAAGGMAAVTGLLLLLFCGAANRYMVDFLPVPVLLAAIGVFALEARLRGWARLAARLAWSVALGWSALFGVLASIQHNDLLRINHPSIYAPLARAGNLPSHWLDRLLGTTYGPLELTVKFPTGRTGRLEPILVNGVAFKSDYLYVLYVDSRHVIFGFEHTGYGGPVSEPVELDFQREHRLRLDLGALYPPKDDPFFDHWTPTEIAAHVQRLRLSLDGRSLMDDPVECYDPVARAPRIGVSPAAAGLGRKFTGVIFHQGRVASLGPDPFGAVRLYLELPRRPAGTSEPLLTSGVAGSGDLLRIIYVDGGHVRFVHDRWGFGGASSPDIAVRYEDRHRIELSMGSLYPDGPWAAAVPANQLAQLRDRVRVVLDGVPVLDVRERSYPALPGTIVIGANAIGASLTTPTFTGRILNQRRVWDP